MATFSTITDGPNDLTEGLLAEQILAELLRENRAPLIAQTISRMHDFTAQGSSKAQNILRLKTAAARTQSTEGAELTPDDSDLDEESITPTTRYYYEVLTWQGRKDFVIDPTNELLQLGVRAILDADDSAGLQEFQNAIANVGSSSSTMDLDLWSTAMYTWATLDAGGMPVFVGHNIHARDLKAALRNSGAALEATGRSLQLFQGVNGLLGEFEGTAIFESSNVSETGSAKIGGLLTMGTLRHGVWNDIDIRTQDAIENLATKLVVWFRAGYVLATNGEASTGADSSVLKVLCKNS